MTESLDTKPPRFRRILFSALAVLTSLIALEIVLQGAASVSALAAALLDRHAGLLLPDDRLIHRPNPAYPEHDAWGFRNAALPDRAFAVALGDSQTYGAMVPRDDAWPQQLAGATGQPVYNMAFGGYGAGEASLLLDQALELDPEWVFLGLYAGNDLFDAYELAYKTETLSRLRSDAPATLALVVTAENMGAIESVFRETHSTRASVKQWFAQYSKLYGLARAVRNTARGSAFQETEPEWASVLEQRVTHPEWVVFDDGTSPTILTPAYRSVALDREDPRIEEGKRITLALFTEMSKRCAEAGAQFAVVALPTKEFVYQDLVRASGSEIDVTLAKLWQDEAAFWEACRGFCAGDGIPFIDTLTQLRASLQEGRRPFRRDGDGHLTPEGNRVVRDTVRVRIAPNET